MARFDIGEGLPLTAAQSGMWFTQQLAPDSPCLRPAEVIEIHGAVEVELLERALRQAVTETEALRVRFVPTGPNGEDGVRQIIDPCADWRFPRVDLRGEADPDAAALAWMWEDLRTPMDMHRAGLFSFAVLRVADERFLFYMCSHHILMDGYATSLFVPRVAEIYTALESGEAVPPSRLGPLRQALEDEAAYAHSEREERDRAYWAEELARCAVSAPATSARLPKPAPSFVRETGHLDAETADALRALARTARTGLATVTMAALALYVHRLSDDEREDAVVDVTVAARGPATRDVPCMVANVLPLRVPQPSSGTVGDLLRKTATQAKALLRHQRYSYVNLVRGPHARRPAAGRMEDWGLNVMLHDPQISFGRHPATLHNLSNGPVTGMAVNVYDRPSDGSLRIDFQADPDIYPAETIAAHQRRFLGLLRTLTATTETTAVEDVELVTAAERERVLAWGRGPERALPHLPLHAAFEERARQEPRATALVCGSGADAVSLSRGDVNARANRLAHLLLARGAGPGTTVALALSRSADYAVALLAVLKTGSACLTLDADHPVERTRQMLADAAPVCVLAARGGRTAAADPSGGAPVLLVDTAATEAELAHCPATDPGDGDRPRALRPHDVAYLAFTSGTTGRPKGVEVEHRQLANLYHDHRTALLSPAAAEVAGTTGRRLRAAQTASFCFDASWEAWLCLAAGHELHLIEDEVRHDPAALAARVEEQRIDLLALTPTHVRALLAAGLFDPGRSHHPGTLLVGGEALDPALWQRLRALPGVAAYNCYGPAECAVDAVWCRLDAEGPDPVIGRPGHNLRAYVLDRHGHLVPPGVPGELHLGGAQVARGYLGAPELTEEKFVRDPFADATTVPGRNGRMYRTGDRVRWTRDGVLEYLGRTDTQLKVHGVRIEPQEVETVLARHPHVAQVAVAAQRSGDDPAGGPVHLAAHVVPAHVVPAQRTADAELTAEAGRAADAERRAPEAGRRAPEPGRRAPLESRPSAPLESRPSAPREGSPSPTPPPPEPAELDPAELRSWAASRLPSAMVPAAFYTHETLPMTPQGKLDRAALLATALPAQATRASRDAQPRTAATGRERTLCALFAEVLEVPEVGLDDDFFALGGHSLSATRLLARVHAELDTELSLGALYQAPTVAQLAKLLDVAAEPGPPAEHAYDMLLPLRTAGEAAPLFCVHPAGGLGWCYATLPPHLPPSVPVYALQAQGLRPTDEPVGTFPELIAQYAARIRSVQPHGPYRLLGWSLGGALAHAVAARLQEEGENVDTLALLDSAPLDRTPPLDPDADPAVVHRLVTEAVGHDLADDAQLNAVTRMLGHYAALRPSYTPAVYRGDAHYFRATETAPEDPPALDARTPGAWHPYLTGTLTLHDLPCTHSAMGRPDVMARVGRLLSPSLTDTAGLRG
ncbi:amino acid adenylation domain-containing protein [Streptomyces sp. 891-h]|uniref:amino acid adenylation domain-containing protein n=1 Tax=Streptomyces sp. 891-h TaxID=2720714 RepID=UPI001FA9BE4A|nr:amino acid adenylation domain-containing protein [Streptomyces sp. 891-h]UNZ17650.1 amino acid adenylation domain-containing protein [Streptomyces sp. 891-h]